MSKSFDNAARADAYSIDPFELCIIGGKALPEGERGKLDTAWDPNHPLHAHDLLAPLDPQDIESVYEHGVLVPIEVVKFNNLPTVTIGRGRVRKARIATVRRKAAGLPPIAVKFTVVRISNSLQLLERMIDENIRRKSVGVLDRIELAKQLLSRGASEDDVAARMGIGRQQLESWLHLEDHATPEVKAALQADRLSPSAAMQVADVADPAKQNEVLAGLLSSPKPTTRAAKRLVRAATGKAATDEKKPASRDDVKRLLPAVEAKTRGSDWHKGAAAALRFVLTGVTDKEIAKLLKDPE